MRYAGVSLTLLSLALGLSGCAHHGKSEKYYLIGGNLKLSYWKTVTSGFNKAGAQLGVTATVAGPDTDDAKAEADEFEKAIAANPALKGQPNIEERLKGYLDVLNEHPGMKIIDVYDVKSDTGTAFDKTRELLARTGNDKVDAFVSLDSASSKDVADAMDRQNVTDRTIIAMDTTKDTMGLIQAGKIEAAVSQKPYTMGYAGLLALAAVHENPPASFSTHYASSATSPYPVFVDTGTSLVDKSNVGTLQQAANTSGGQ